MSNEDKFELVQRKDLSNIVGSESFLNLIERNSNGFTDIMPSVRYFVELESGETRWSLGSFSDSEDAQDFYGLCEKYVDSGARVVLDGLDSSGLYLHEENPIKIKSVSRKYSR